MKEARLSILKQISDGTLSADEGQKLLEELENESRPKRFSNISSSDFGKVSLHSFDQMS
ncbi:MAG: hypothetical protein ACFFDW_09540, partial [Candidatus Thorarchaeota archaeon]